MTTQTKFPIPGVCLVALALLMMPAISQAASYNFQKINNKSDPNFNQLLGINNSGTIAGYYGDGNTVPNNGYTVAPPYGQASFTLENVPGAAQTQVVGLNNSGVTVGFSVDAVGTNAGFVRSGSTLSTPVTDPNTPPTSPSAPSTNQLLGVNDSNLAAGFYVDSSGNAHGYIFNIAARAFTAVNPTGATSSTATGINNAGDISGFLTTASGNTAAYYHNKEFEVPGSTNTGFFGLNNKDMAIGYYVDASGLTDGLVYNTATGSWYTVDDPNASPNPAFDITGTTINGINDLGQLVGFYSDGTHVNGLLATPTPEPASLGMMGAGGFLALALYLKRRQARV